MGSTADEDMEEIPPLERPRLLNASGRQGGEGQRGTPPSSARPRREARERGGTPVRNSKGTSHKGGHQTRKGDPSAHTERGPPRQDGDEEPPRTAARA